MTTFAEEVYREVFGAPVGSYRWLGDRRWEKAVRDGEEIWVGYGPQTLTNLAMWEATVNG